MQRREAIPKNGAYPLTEVSLLVPGSSRTRLMHLPWLSIDLLPELTAAGTALLSGRGLGAAIKCSPDDRQVACWLANDLVAADLEIRGPDDHQAQPLGGNQLVPARVVDSSLLTSVHLRHRKNVRFIEMSDWLVVLALPELNNQAERLPE